LSPRKEIDVEELKVAVEGFAQDSSDTKPLREAAAKWASFCVWNLTGDALGKGLAVSASIAKFLNEIGDSKD
jgi:hypothetical protein